MGQYFRWTLPVNQRSDSGSRFREHRVRTSAIPFLALVLALATALVLVVQLATPVRASAAARSSHPARSTSRPARSRTPAAPAGRGPVSKALPASATAHHGYPKGTRPPVVPPGIMAAGKQYKLSAQQLAAAPKPATPKPAVTAVKPAVTAAPADGATNLILRSGFDFNDTSLVLYFDAPAPGISGWQSWKATVYDPSTGAAQDSVALKPSDAALCQAPAQYCRSFGSADGWALTGGHQYYVTITVTFTDGTTAVSAASAQASARTVADPPPLPSAQVAGCSCADVLFPTGGGQVVRGSGVNTATGAFSMSADDLRLAGFGATFDAARTYASDNVTAGSMGIGWSWSYDIKVIPPASGQTSVTVRAEDGAQAVYTAGSGAAYNRPVGVRANLSAVSGGGWKLVTPDQTSYTFDTTGRLVSVLDTHGNGVKLAYTSSAITLTDAAGRVVTGALNSSGLLTSLTLPDRRKVSFTYTGSLLTAATDAAGNTWTFGYTNGLLTTLVDPTGVTQLTNTYSGNRVVKQVDPSGAATTFAWDATNQESTTTDPDGVPYYDGYRGNSWVYSQNGNGDTANQRYDNEINADLFVDPEGNQTVKAYDASSNLTSMTAAAPFDFQVSNTYDASNNLTTHTDGLGHTSRFGYTSFDELTSVVAPAGDDTTFTYDSRGLVTAMTDPRGKTTSLAYDSSGNLVSQTTPMGEKSTYTYDAAGRMLTAVDPRGNLSGATALNFTTTYGYDNLDRVTSVLAPRKAHPSTTSYNSRGEVTGTADPLSHSWSYTYDSVLGRTATTTDPNGGITSYTYTTAGRQASVTDPVGDKTTMTYDSRGNVSTVTSPGGNVPGANAADFTTTYTYDFNENRVRTSHPYPGGGTITKDTRFDQLNRGTSSIDPLGNTTTTTYDNNGNVTSVADPQGGTSSYTYDADGRPVAMTAPTGGGFSDVYDAAGNIIKSTSPTGGVSTFTYNDDGKVATAVDPRGNASGANPADYTADYGYDAAGNLASLTDQLGAKTTFTYDSNNRVTAATDAKGHAVTYKYLDDNTIQAVIGPDGNTKADTTYSYDNVGNVVSRTDAVGNTRYTYDKLGRVVDYKNPINFDTLFTYDAEGNLASKVLPAYNTPASATTISYSYDILDRLTSENEAGNLVHNWGFDADNDVTSLADPSGVRNQTFDSLGRLTSVSRGGQSFSYGYDSDGNVTSRTWPDGTTLTSTYDAGDQQTGLTVSGGQAGSTPASYGFSYDPSGRLSRTTYPTANHLTTDRTYDHAGRISDLNSHDDSGTVARYQLTRDPVGNPTGITTTRGAASQHVAYTYDAFDRLTAACVGAGCTSPTGKIAYTYDGVGNRLSQTLSGSAGNSTTSYTYDSASQLNSSTTTTPAGSTQTTYLYDRPGHLVQEGNDTFTYNLDGTMSSATVGGNTTNYAYDAQGLQLSATTNAGTGSAQTRTWQTDVNAGLPQLALETDTSGGTSTTKGFLQGPDFTPVGLLTGGSTDSYAPDTVDGVASVLTPSGTTAAEYDYDPFGNARTDGTASVAPTVDNPIKFAGGYQDSTLGNRYSSVARAYDPSTGRFNGVDPVGQSDREPSASPYAYVADRATNYRDPSGACSSDPNHNAAQALALKQLDANYGYDNVYADCPNYRKLLHGGPLQVAATQPAANPDIVVGMPGFTYLYEVKPASDQLSGAWVGTKNGPKQLPPRQELWFSQMLRYLYALRAGGYPNVQPGPDILPDSMTYPDGTILTIFSGSDWGTYAASDQRAATYDNTGIIYYRTIKPPRRRAPTKPPATPGAQTKQNDKETPKQDPADTPTQGPADPGAVSEDWAGDLITLGASFAIAAVVVALLPEEIVGGLLFGGAELAEDAGIPGAATVVNGIEQGAKDLYDLVA